MSKIPIFIQYAFWPNCNNNCGFCLHKGKKKHSASEMLNDVKMLHSAMKNDFQNAEEPIDISFIGGDFFDDQLDDENVRKAFYEMTETCAMYNSLGKLKRFMVCSSLIFDIDHCLKNYIDFLCSKKLLTSFMICTSYDTCYRFKTVKAEKMWKENMLKLRDLGVNVHTETILTQDFINKVLENKFDIESFQQQFSTIVDFIEPTCIGSISKSDSLKLFPNFFPSRKSFLNFIQKVCFIDKSAQIDTILNIKLRSRFVRFVNEERELAIVDDRWKNDCRRYDNKGRSIPIYTYSDSAKTMIDDLRALKYGI